jgi:hypothetical protein
MEPKSGNITQEVFEELNIELSSLEAEEMFDGKNNSARIKEIKWILGDE